MTELVAIGIDLGTTYCAVAIVNSHGEADLIPNAESERLTPSAVFFEENTILVGQVAKDAASTHPEDVVLFVKRQISDPNWFFMRPERRFSAADISALVLKKLRQDAELYVGHPITYAVITVPAYFEDAPRRLTEAAGEIAGFKMLGLINEPTAAAIAFGVGKQQHGQTVLVYDLGGGTFDVTIMRIDNLDFRVLSTDGHPLLGGKDFDDALIRHVSDIFIQEHGIDPTINALDAADIRTQVEKVKRELSKRTKAVLMVRAQGWVSKVEVSREQFERLIRPRLDTTLTIIRSALKDAQLSPQQIDRILLIGGSTRIPLVHQLLATFFNKQPDSSVNPDEAVALGAAIVAAKRLAELAPQDVIQPIADKIGGLQITDVLSHSVGIEAAVPGTTQRRRVTILPRNTPLPSEQSREFTTSEPGQTLIKVPIYQGEFDDVALCNPIGEFLLGGLPANRPAGRRVRVTFICGIDGVIQVHATDIESGLETTTTVNYKSGQTAQQVSAKQRWMETQDIQ